jgi:alpha 1,3-glucosidase
LIKKDNIPFQGECWCKEAVYLDFYNQVVREYWGQLYHNRTEYFLADNIHIWNDMNEPSVFDHSELTLPKTATFKYNETIYQTRDSHNIYGYLMHKTSYEAIRNKYDKRPFLLTRAFYIGSHKYAATWTGDTRSTFHDLKLSISMIINNSISGYSFIGADVGGFAGEGQHYLYYRWYQLGVFNPFFRAHSQNETWRREPWLYDTNTLNYIRNAIVLRYKLTPFIYRTFYESHKTGYPIIRPMWMKYDDNDIDEYSDVEFMFGDSLLVRPVVNENEHLNNSISVLLPERDRWYDFYDYKEIIEKGSITYRTTNDKIGVFIKGGSMIPMKWRLRRSTKVLKHDPLTLVIALDNDNKASGFIYLDDEESYLHETNSEYLLSKVTVVDNTIQLVNYMNKFVTRSYIERIVLLGVRTPITNVIQNSELIRFNEEQSKVTMHKLHLNIAEDWSIELKTITNDL